MWIKAAFSFPVHRVSPLALYNKGAIYCVCFLRMDGMELNALISLIDDPDEEIYAQIKSKLLSFGPEVIPLLEDAWENHALGLLFQSRIEDIVHLIHFEDVKSHLCQWAESDEQDLLEGMLLVNRYQYPDLDQDKIRTRINQIIKDVWIEINDDLTGFEQIKVINHILYEVHGFRGNHTHFHALQNSYLNNVLETHKGNPLSLGVLYLLIAQSLNLPLYGVNLPHHFILIYQTPHIETNLPQEEKDQLVFYINAFSRGNIFPREEIDKHIQQLKLDPVPGFYQPCSHIVIVKQVINHLINSYKVGGYPDKIRELGEIRDLLDRY